ncbi:MAG: MoxR family ATPase [Prosthecochloris sp.]|nr:MoxR family ATPase [Prosthecochloris sp.]
MQHDARLEELSTRIREASGFVGRVHELMSRYVVGQDRVLDRVLVTLLCNGHILLEGVPGLAKTLIVRTFAAALDLSFRRLQFTPDMLPADLVGTMVYHPQQMTFSARKGALFANVIMADEINRAPAKVQSALLEAMEERQVTIGDEAFRLPVPFMVLATQNPVEHEGTYLLPEAQLDRFMLKVIVDYPSYDEELEIMRRSSQAVMVSDVVPVVQPSELDAARALLGQVHVDERLRRYIVDLVSASRSPARLGLDDLGRLVEAGASPRASIFLQQAARAHAFLHHRAFCVPEDVKSLAPDVLRHRIRLSYEAEADNVTPDECVSALLQKVPVP